MRSDMTKQRISNVLAVATLALVVGAGAGVLAQGSGVRLATGVHAQGLPNTPIQNSVTASEASTNDGVSILNGVTATTTSVSVTGDVTRNSSIHTNLTVGFPFEVSVPNGSVRVLIPTATDGAKAISDEAQENAFILPKQYLDGSNKIDGTKIANMFTCPGNGATTGGANFSATNVQVILYDTETERYYDDVAMNATSVNDGTADIPVTAGRFARYIAYTCTYTGTPIRGGAVSNDNKDNDYQMVVKDLINPKANPLTRELDNKAITTPARVQMFSTQTNTSDVLHMTSDMPVLISTVMQDVLVKARVDYSLTFRVDGVEANDDTIKCANKPTVSSSPLKIDYGSASVGVPVDAAQRLFVNSSVTGGYKITMTQNRNMRRQDTLNDLRDNTTYQKLCYADYTVDRGTDPYTINRDCIPNLGWKTDMKADTSVAWDGTGFGYTVAVDTHGTTTENFSNTPTVNSIFETAGTSDGSMVEAGGKYYTRLATRDNTGIVGVMDQSTNTEDEPIVVAQSKHIADGDYYDVCYRLAVDAQNNAGVYDNEVTYTITASL